MTETQREQIIFWQYTLQLWLEKKKTKKLLVCSWAENV